MSNFDLGLALGSLLVALLVIAWSPFYRTIVFECFFHPRSEGWIDSDEEGTIQVYRGESLPDYMLNGALKALEETCQAVEQEERKESPSRSPSSEPGDWRVYAKAAAVAGIGFLSAYLLRRENGSSRREN